MLILADRQRSPVLEAQGLLLLPLCATNSMARLLQLMANVPRCPRQPLPSLSDMMQVQIASVTKPVPLQLVVVIHHAESHLENLQCHSENI